MHYRPWKKALASFDNQPEIKLSIIGKVGAAFAQDRLQPPY